MKVEMRLKKVLVEYGKYGYGMEKQIADECGIHRHTVGKLFRNEAKNPSLEVLGKISWWLVKNGVPPEILPGALIGFKPSNLWRAIGQSDRVTLYLGIYEHSKTLKHAIFDRMSIARHDAVVVSKITHFLTSRTEAGDKGPMVHTKYVPFQYRPHQEAVAGKWFEEDKARAKAIYEKMRGREAPESVILLGSQRVNYITEFLVSDLFRCRPFTPAQGAPRVPIYQCYREKDRPVPRCFGGRNPPPRWGGEAKPGTYYMDRDGVWQILERKDSRQGSGIVIVIRDGDAIELALFGFSGRATNAIGNELIEHADRFWAMDGNSDQRSARQKTKRMEVIGTFGLNTPPQPGAKKKGREISIYLCRVDFNDTITHGQSYADEDYEGDRVGSVIQLSNHILYKYL